jgi:DNA invertase Pin-like site-specific DNA recombinase
MAKQKQAEECVLYVRVSTTRQAEDGVSIDAQIAKGKANAEFRNLLLPDENIFIDDGVSAKVPLWSRPAAKQMKAFILKQKIKHIFAYRMDRLFRSTIDCLATVEELDEFGVGIHFCESGGQPLDLSSAVGRCSLQSWRPLAKWSVISSASEPVWPCSISKTRENDSPTTSMDGT